VKLWQSGGQQAQHFYYDASGTIASGGTAQLLLPQSKSRSHLIIVNNSSGALYIQFGIQPAVATLTNKVVTSVSVPDGGFGFTVAPTVMFLGGGNNGDPASQGATMPDWPSPANPAQGIVVMASSAISGNKINSITVTNGGSGYLAPPYVAIYPDRTDPTGVGTASATTFPLQANGGNLYLNGTCCPTDAISIYGATTGQAFVCKYML